MNLFQQACIFCLVYSPLYQSYCFLIFSQTTVCFDDFLVSICSTFFLPSCHWTFFAAAKLLLFLLVLFARLWILEQQSIRKIEYLVGFSIVYLLLFIIIYYLFLYIMLHQILYTEHTFLNSFWWQKHERGIKLPSERWKNYWLYWIKCQLVLLMSTRLKQSKK